MAMDVAAYKDALARFPSGVCVVTTVDESERPWGFTASAFCALSLDPPLVLVCLDQRADSHATFVAANGFAISILASHQMALALRFATRAIEKFEGVAIRYGSATGLPLIPEAVVHLECRMHQTVPIGDHTILVGEVVGAVVAEGEPLVTHNRQYGAFLERRRDTVA